VASASQEDGRSSANGSWCRRLVNRLLSTYHNHDGVPFKHHLVASLRLRLPVADECRPPGRRDIDKVFA
jgi:hypothetical protein